MSRSNPTVGPAGTEDAGDGVADTDTGADADTEGCGVVEAMPAIVPAAPPRPAGRLGAHRPAGRDSGGTRDSGEQGRGSETPGRRGADSEPGAGNEQRAAAI